MKRNTAIAAAIFVLVFFFFLSNNKSVRAASNATVTTSVLNVRAGPGIEYEKITSIKMGNTYPVISSQDGWYRLQIGTSSGWVCGDYVNIDSSEAAAPPPSVSDENKGGISAVESVTVSANQLNVRNGNSTKYSIIGQIKTGSVYTVLDVNSNWYKIQYGSKQGWVCGDYVLVNYKKETEKNDTTDGANLSNVCTVDEVKFYKSGTKNSIAITVIMKVKKDSSTVLLKPGTNHEKTPDGKIKLLIDNCSYNGNIKEITGKDDDLFSLISIETKAGSINEFTINPKMNVHYEVYDVQAKDYEDQDYRYLKSYVVISLTRELNAPSLPEGVKGQGMEKNKDNKSKKDYIVALDAGHGGQTSGAVNKGFEEKTFNLDIVMRLNNILKAQGYDTYLTRENDTYVPLLERTDGANILKTNILVSIHLNSFASQYINGTETLYDEDDMQSGRLAGLLQKNITDALNTRNRGTKERPDLAVINSTQMPAVLAEVLFISNEAELGLISKENTRQRTAEAIAKGINEYFCFSN